MEFFNSLTVKVVTFCVVMIAFIASPFLQRAVAKSLTVELQEIYIKLAKDALVKTLLMFAGAALFGSLAFFKGDVEKAISQSMFGLSLFTAIESAWSIAKTKDLIKEAREASEEGGRQKKISEIEYINSVLAKKPACISFLLGFIGCIYMQFFYDTYIYDWVWFVAFMSTGPAILSARWSDAANAKISKYASDSKFGV